MSEIVCACRAGFEQDCREEIVARAGAAGWRPGAAVAEPGRGLVTVPVAGDAMPLAALAALTQPWPVFAREVILAPVELRSMPSGDRVSAIVAAASALGSCGDVWIETTDAEATRPLLPLCRSLLPPLREALRKRGVLREGAGLPRLHVFFSGSTSAWIGLAMPAHAARWPMGIPRLMMPREAPSRSVLKLDEALLVFLDEGERARLLRAGLKAVDLGAAPGGWSWLLAQQGLRVTAVDNGRMAEQVMKSGLIEHRREDGFAFRPRQRVDWLVCDIVEQPQRVAQLVGRWFAERWCRQAIFNLKLPMKKRHAAVMQARATIEQALPARNYALQFRQLYHDREEVTGYYRDLQS